MPWLFGLFARMGARVTPTWEVQGRGMVDVGEALHVHAMARPEGVVVYGGQLLQSGLYDGCDASEYGCIGQDTCIQVLAGYDASKNVFLFLEYVKDGQSMALDEACMVCLEPIISPHPVKDVPIRIVRGRCSHNLHLHCYNHLCSKGLKPLPCCEGGAQKLFHMRIQGYRESCVIKTPFGSMWWDIERGAFDLSRGPVSSIEAMLRLEDIYPALVRYPVAPWSVVCPREKLIVAHTSLT